MKLRIYILVYLYYNAEKSKVIVELEDLYSSLFILQLIVEALSLGLEDLYSSLFILQQVEYISNGYTK